MFNPVYVMANFLLAIAIFDHLQAYELGEVAEEEGRYQFLCTASPLQIRPALARGLPLMHTLAVSLTEITLTLSSYGRA